MSATARLFVAVPLGDEVQRGLARAIDTARLAAPRARWVAAADAHLTLAFLGAVAVERAPAIAAALTAVAARQRPFSLEIGGAGTFGRTSSPRVLWLGVRGDLDALAALHREVTAALASLGFPAEDRAFRPHLTLARARDLGGDRGLGHAAERLATTQAGRVRVTAVALMQSHLGARGARYTTRAAAPLAATGG